METYNGMIKATDDELYYAKNHGRTWCPSGNCRPKRESVPSSVSVTRAWPYHVSAQIMILFHKMLSA